MDSRGVADENSFLKWKQPQPGTSTDTVTMDVMSSDGLVDSADSNIIPSTSKTGSKSRSLQQVKERRESAWAAKQQLLVETAVSSLAPPSDVCCHCGEHESQGIIRCQDCGPAAFFCHSCFDHFHQHTKLHYAEIWQKILYLRYAAQKNAWTRTDGHECADMTQKTIEVIDRHGRQHTVSIMVCPCEDILVTLLRHQLWAASPTNPAVAFHLDLMEWARVLQMEAHVSTQKLVNTMAAMSNAYQTSLPRIKKVSIYQSFIKGCMEEYRYFFQQLQSSGHVLHLKGVDDGTKCPSCHGDLEGNKIISLDGNFGLVRKKSAGSSCFPPRYQTKVFLDQPTVDSFVEQRLPKTTSSGEKQSCSDFQAGSALRSKGKAQKLDEKGVLGSACNHEMPLLFCNLKHGERFPYPAVVLQELFKLPQFKKAQVTVAYDVACQLEGHLQANYQQLPHDRLKLAIPVFHAFGHKQLCQLSKSLRVTPGAGLADGEVLERLWSFLRCFGPMTKEMMASKRSDLLTDAVLHYCRKERAKLGHRLRERLERAERAQQESKKDLETLSSAVPGDIPDVPLLKQWEEEDIQDVASVSSRTYTRTTATQDYAMKLSALYLNPSSDDAEKDVLVLEQKHHFQRSEWVPTSELYQKTMHEAVCNTREQLLNKMRQEAFDRKFQITTLRKYGVGQAIANRIGQQINKATKKLKKDLDDYNALSHCEPSQNCPKHLTFEEVSAPDSCTYMGMSQTRQGTVPRKLKRQMVAAFNKLTRANEEKSNVCRDFDSALKFLVHEHTQVKQALMAWLRNGDEHVDLSLIPEGSRLGEGSFMFHKMWSYEREVSVLCSALGRDNPLTTAPAARFLEHVLQGELESSEMSGDVDCAVELIEELHDEADVQEVLESLDQSNALTSEHNM